MLRRVGARINPGAPYALHCCPAAVSRAGSHALAAARPFGLSGMLATSPRAGVTMRQRQSSLITATQYPFRSIGALALGVGGAAGVPPRPCAETAVVAPIIASATTSVLNGFLPSSGFHGRHPRTCVWSRGP